MRGRRLVEVAALAALVLGYRAQRRRAERAIAQDPEWSELRRELESKPFEVTSADGTRLRAEVFGADGAPTIVLVHGWCCAVRFWRYQLRDLAAEYRVVAYDLRGHGGSERPANRDYSTAALAADLDAVLRACVPDGEQTVVVGHSMGGMSLVAWVGDHPDEVGRRLDGVVVVDSAVRHLAAESRVGQAISGLAAVRRAAGRLLLRIPVPVPAPPDPVGCRAIRHIALSPSARPGHVAFCTGLVSDCPPRVRAAFGATLGRLDLGDCLGALAVPAVVVVGSDDVLTPPPQSETIAGAVRGAELYELPAVGHMAPVEGHQEVTRYIRAMAERTL